MLNVTKKIGATRIPAAAPNPALAAKATASLRSVSTPIKIAA